MPKTDLVLFEGHAAPNCDAAKSMTKILLILQTAAEQFNGREGETATLLSRCPLNSNGFGGGFAPRHLSRYASRLKTNDVVI